MAKLKKPNNNENPCAKKVTRDKAYEIWKGPNGWTWYVLKKYQSPQKEAQNPKASWHCFTVSQIVPEGEYGDVLVSEIKRFGTRVA